MPYSTTLSSMHRFPGMLGLLQLSPPDMPVTQESLLSFLLPPAGISQRASRRTPDWTLSVSSGFPVPVSEMMRLMFLHESSRDIFDTQ